MSTKVLSVWMAFYFTFSSAAIASEDPASMLKRLSGDLIVYNQLKSEKIEQKYNDMIVQHRSNSDRVITTYKKLTGLWTRIADKLNRKQLMNSIEEEGEQFVAAVSRARDETFSSDLEALTRSAAVLVPLFSKLYNQTEHTAEVKSQAQELNAANESFTSAVSTYLSYCNNQFKTVADRKQVIDVIRSRIEDALMPEYDEAKTRMSNLEQKKAKLQSRLDVLVAELSSLQENTPTAQKRRKEIITEIDSINIDLNQLDEEIGSVTQLIRDYEDLLSEVGI